MHLRDIFAGTSCDRSMVSNALRLGRQLLNETERSPHEIFRLPKPSGIKRSTDGMDCIILDFRKPTPGSPEPYRIVNRKNIHKVSVLTRYYASKACKEKLVYSLVLSSFSTKMDFLMDPKFSQYLSQKGLNVITDADFYQLFYLVATDIGNMDGYNRMVEESLKFSGTSDACLGALLCATGNLPIDFGYMIDFKALDGRVWLSISSKCDAKADGVCAAAKMVQGCNVTLYWMLQFIGNTRRHLFNAMRNVPDKSSFRCISDIFFNRIEWYGMFNYVLITETLIKNSLYLLFQSEIGERVKTYYLINQRFATKGKEFKFLKYIEQDIPDDPFESYDIKFLAYVAKVMLLKKGHYALEHYKISDTDYYNYALQDYISESNYFNLSKELKTLIALHSSKINTGPFLNEYK